MSKLGFWVDYDRKIVCNELRRQGLMSTTDWIYDANYCAKRFDPTTYQGYRLWAGPCQRMMQRHRVLACALAILVRWMAADIRYQYGIRKNPHWLGFLIHQGIFWPGNRLLGNAVQRCRALGQHISRAAQGNHSAATPQVGPSTTVSF